MNWIGILILFSLPVFCPVASADEDLASIPSGCDVIGLVRFYSKDYRIAGPAKHDIDSIVPRLKKMGKGKLVKIEGRSSPVSDREKYITDSMYLAKEVQQYLLSKHNLQLDLYIGATDDKIIAGNYRVVRIILFPDDFGEDKIDIITNNSQKFLTRDQ